MTTTVRISLNDKLIKALDILKQEYPTLDDAEIFKLALSVLIQSKINTSNENNESKLKNFLRNYQNKNLKISQKAQNYTDFKDYQKENYKYE